MPTKHDSECLFCLLRPARALRPLSGHGPSVGLGDVVAFCSMRCAARAALAFADSHPKVREFLETTLIARETRRELGMPSAFRPEGCEELDREK